MEWINETLGIAPGVRTKLFLSAIAIAALLLARWLALRALHRRLEQDGVAYRSGKAVTYVTTVAIALALAWIWIDSFSNLATYLGLASAGIAIALSDVLKNLAGWAYIVVRRPFRVGDRVEVVGTIGDVIDIRVFRFTLAEVGNWVHAEQATGRIVHVPNGVLFINQIANYTEGFDFVWHEVPILVTFESNWHAAEALVREVLASKTPDIEAKAGTQVRAIARSYHLKVGILTPTVYVSVKDSGVLLTARFLVDVRQRRVVEERVWRGVLDAFAGAKDVDLAYPTIRSYLPNPVELRLRPDQSNQSED